MAVSKDAITRGLKDVEDPDKDVRYMAISDLATELGKEGQIDPPTQRRITAAILERMEKDDSADVQTIAVRSLKELVSGASEDTVTQVCNTLATQLAHGKAEIRDVFAIGLKKVVSEVEDEQGFIVIRALLKPLYDDVQGATGVSAEDQSGIRVEALDVLNELLTRFGGKVVEAGRTGAATVSDAALLSVLLNQLGGAEADTPKRAMLALSALSAHLSDDLLQRLMDALLGAIAADGKPGAASGAGAAGQPSRMVVVQAIGAVSRQVGWRLSAYLERVLPLLEAAMGSPDEEGQESDEVCELRENCLHAVESLAERCAADMAPHVPRVRSLCLRFMSFDPNYSYEDADDAAGEGDEDEFDDYGDDEYGGYEMDDGDGMDADEDGTWKVRRGALRTLRALLRSRPEDVKEYFDGAAGSGGQSPAVQLLDRVKEREESVRQDVLQCLRELLRATVVVEGNARVALPAAIASRLGIVQAEGAVAGSMGAAGGVGMAAAAAAGLLQPPVLVRQKSAADLLAEEVGPATLEKLSAELSKPSGLKPATRSAMLDVLLSLQRAAGGALAGSAALTIGAGVSALSTDSSQVQLDGLRLLTTCMEMMDSRDLLPLLGPVVDQVTRCCAGEWYRLVAEALRTAGRIALVLRPMQDDGSAFRSDVPAPDSARCDKLFDAVLARLREVDIDQEVKESAITASGLLLSSMGDLRPGAVDEVLPVLQERLDNEVTRTATLRALTFAATSPAALDLKKHVPAVLDKVAALLRQKSRQVRQSSLAALDALLSKHADASVAKGLEPVLQSTAAMVDASDAYLAYLALRVAVDALRAGPAAAAHVKSYIYPRALQLSASPLVQGSALRALRSYFDAAVEVGGAAEVGALADAIVQYAAAGSGGASGGAASGAGAGGGDEGEQAGSPRRQGLLNAARCLASVAKAGGSAASGILKRFSDDAAAAAANPSACSQSQLLSVTSIGECGAEGLLAGDAQKRAFDSLMSSIEGDAEDLKSVASIALGALIVGSTSEALPAFLARLSKDDGADNYYLLSALRECLERHAPATQSGPDFSPVAGKVLPILASKAETEDEGIRNMVAACLGLLAAASPGEVFPRVTGMASDGASSPGLRWVACTSVRFGVTAAGAGPFAGCDWKPFLALLHDADLSVRHAALLTLGALIYHAPSSLRSTLRLTECKIPLEAEPEVDLDGVGVLPLLYYETARHADRVRKVQLGPFSHEIDDGLPLRKAAFSALDAIFTFMSDRADSAFLPALCKGLQDPADDVVLLTHHTLLKLISNKFWQIRVTAAIDDVVEGLKRPFDALATGKKSKMPGNDVLRSSLRVIESIYSNCKEAMSTAKFEAVLQQIDSNPKTKEMLADIRSGP